MKYFNGKLYLECLKRLRLAAIIFMVFLLGAIALWCVDLRISGKEGLEKFYLENGALYLFSYIGSFVLTYVAFSFLQKRSASDLYHSMPVSRLCMLFSNLAAMFTVILCEILISSLISLLITVLLKMEVDIILFLFSLMFYVLVALVVAGCTLIGMSFSGTKVTAFLMAFLVLAVPRGLLLLMQNMILAAGPSLTVELFWPVFAPENNFACLPLVDLFVAEAHGNASGIGYAYTLCLGVLSLAVGAGLFCTRKSELAGKVLLPNRRRAVFRVMITLPFLAMFFMMLMFGICVPNGAFETIPVVLTGVLAITVYFLYELAVTRKISAVVRTVPLFLGVSAAVALGAVGVLNIGKAMNSYVPEVTQVEAVQILGRYYNPNSFGYDMRYEDEESYVSANIHAVKYREEEMIELILGGLKDYNAFDASNFDAAIILKNGERQRRHIRLADPLGRRVNELQYANADFRKAQATLPDAKRVMVEGLSHKDAVSLYHRYMVDIAEREQVFLSDASKEPCIASIQVTSEWEGKPTTDYFSINDNYPRTYEKYMELIGNGEALAMLMDDLEDSPQLELRLYVSSNDNYINTGEGNQYPEDFARMKEIIRGAAERTPQEDYITAEIIAVAPGSKGYWPIGPQRAYARFTPDELKELFALGERFS